MPDVTQSLITCKYHDSLADKGPKTISSMVLHNLFNDNLKLNAK